MLLPRRPRLFFYAAALAIVAASMLWPLRSPVQAQAAPNPKLDPALVAQLGQALPGSPIEVVIVFSDLTAVSRVQALASQFYRMQILPMAGAIVTADQIPIIASWPEVYSVTYNAPLKYFLHESVQTIRADQVWTTYGQVGGNPNVAVAIVDSGIDGTHPDLPFGSKVVQNVKVLPYQVAIENQPLTDTTSGHGTHVAGTIGGNGAASGGYYRGVAPGVRLVGLGAGEATKILTATEAYDWVLQHHAQYGIRVVSNSWGSTGGELNLRDPIAIATLEAYKRGILSVFAAGNDGGYDVMNPYSLAPWVLSVAAGRKDGPLADFSSRGKDGDYFKHPDLTAPGVNIYATRSKTVGVTATDPFPNPVNPLWTTSYTVLSGTSMATPHVSGAAALLFSANPQLSPDQVIDLLTLTTKPMPGYALHEAGNGYLDALAAYQASRNVTGNLPAFLAGSRQHGEAEVLGLSPNPPIDEVTFSGFSAVGISDTPSVIDHPFQVPSDATYIDIQLTWMPQTMDAFDLEVIDPQGRVVVSSGNSVGQAEAVLFVPESAGNYLVRLHPFVGAAVDYKVVVRIARAGMRSNPTPAYQYYLAVTSVYKTYGALGLGSDYFRGGDSGFIVFTLVTPDGKPAPGLAGSLSAVYTDRTGRVVLSDTAIVDRDGGEYETSFNTGASGWSAAPGPIKVSFGWTGTGAIRATPTGFSLNSLATSLRVDTPDPRAGAPLSFSGDVAQRTSVAVGTVQTAPVAGAKVDITLVDRHGTPMTSTSITSDAQGHYSGSLAAPGDAVSWTTLVAEATYNDPTIAAGPSQWYGRASATVRFPGNVPPDVTLQVTPEGTKKSANNFLIAIDATIADDDGRPDVTGASLVLQDARGHVFGRWSLADFTAADDRRWTLHKVTRVSGHSPWTITLTAQDSAGQKATASQTVK